MKLLKYLVLIFPFYFSAHVFAEETSEPPADEATATTEGTTTEPVVEAADEAEEKPAE